MIFNYKSHLPSRVKCLIKMGGGIITPRNLKYNHPQSILKPYEYSLNEQKPSFINSYNYPFLKNLILWQPEFIYIEHMITIFIWVFYDVLYKK